MRKLGMLLVGLCGLAMLTAQNTDTVKGQRIKHKIETEIDYEDGLNVKRIMQEEFYDQQGRLIEFKDLTKDGKIKEWIKYTYNAQGQELTIVTLDNKEKVVETIKYEYLNGLKVKRSHYDNKERLVKEKFYDYEYFK